MGERVSVREGILPMVIVAPHGYDDPQTDLIAETLAEKLDCYAVLNHGWERADVVDADIDKANCNSISQIHEDVVKDEFLDPVLRYMHRSSKTIAAYRAGGGWCAFLRNPLMVTIHGAGNDIRNKAAKKVELDFILGTGAGNPARPSCQAWRKNALAWTLINKGVHVWEGKAGGAFAAWGKDNLNQLFVHKYPNVGESLQIEIVRSPWRETPARATATGSILADAFKELLKMVDFTQFQGDLGISSC